MARLRYYGVATVLVFSSPVAADPIRLPTYVSASPAADAADLARLAPPSRRATAQATYGDAAVRPSHIARRHDPGFVCLELGASRDRCKSTTRARVETSHVFTPAYVSAPQIVGAAPGRPSPLRSPFVGFVFDAYDAANALLPAAR